MKRMLIFFIILFVSVNVSIAEVAVTLQQLEGTWVVIDPTYDDMSETCRFSNNQFTWIRQYKFSSRVETLTNKIQYYLSTGIPTKYDSTLVGKIKSGTHIIYYAPKRKLIKNYEIVSLKGDTLVISYYAPRAVGRNAGTVTLTLKRVSR